MYYGFHVGFMGTSQKDLTARQVKGLLRYLSQIEGALVVHHGDHVKASAQFHEIAREVGAFICIHPPTNSRLRAFCRGDVLYTAKEYPICNHDIVHASRVLLAAPKEQDEQLRSCTWAAVRYARKVGCPVKMFYPHVG